MKVLIVNNYPGYDIKGVAARIGLAPENIVEATPEQIIGSGSLEENQRNIESLLSLAENEPVVAVVGVPVADRQKGLDVIAQLHSLSDRAVRFVALAQNAPHIGRSIGAAAGDPEGGGHTLTLVNTDSIGPEGLESNPVALPRLEAQLDRWKSKIDPDPRHLIADFMEHASAMKTRMELYPKAKLNEIQRMSLLNEVAEKVGLSKPYFNAPPLTEVQPNTLTQQEEVDESILRG